MGFIVKNTEFTCQWCGEVNPPAEKTCRNHCRNCLCSKHLDHEFPGDRMSTCEGKMEPVAVLPHSKHEWVILHTCSICGKEIQNKKATDDSIDRIAEVMKESQKRKFFGE